MRRHSAGGSRQAECEDPSVSLGKEIMRSVFGHKSLPSIDPVLSVGMERAPLTRTERVVKRASDIALAGTALVLLSPLMLMTALAIRLDGVGPIMVRRRRTGFDRRAFFIYKFRTPSVTEEGTQIVRTRRSGLRDTEAGRMLETVERCRTAAALQRAERRHVSDWAATSCYRAYRAGRGIEFCTSARFEAGHNRMGRG